MGASRFVYMCWFVEKKEKGKKGTARKMKHLGRDIVFAFSITQWPVNKLRLVP